ncbi:hypothetical protein RB595_001093 [Gaeumannomyces hyphopodioides]
MFSTALTLTLAVSPFVAAHGKVAVVTGDLGGNTTGLGILGAVVPGPGPNRKTEVDTTVFRSTNIKTDGLGKTGKNGKNTVDMVDLAMAQSGNTLPQVSDGGYIQGVFHIVTTDGAGPVRAVLDTTATGAFSNGVLLNVDQQVPGKNGNIRASRNNKRTLLERAWDALASTGLIMKRASNVNTDHPVKFTIPAGTKCTGTIKDQNNVCLVKIANSNPAGPFGGVVAIQQAASGGTAREKRAVEWIA